MGRGHSFREADRRLTAFCSSRMVPICLLAIAILGRPSPATVLPALSDEEKLQRYGYATKTEEDIQVILRNDICAIREMGLRVLVKRQGRQAIATLKSFLADKKLPARVTAASLLAQIGDSSGLPVMRQGYISLIGSDEKQRDVAAIKKLSPYAINPGLKVAKVLAELGDYRGYYLAVYIFEHPDSRVAPLRYDAITVLGEIARAAPDRLASEGIDIRSAYDKAIRSIDDWVLFRKLLLTVDQEGVDPNLASHVVNQMLETHRLGAGPEMYVRDVVKPRVERRLQQAGIGSRVRSPTTDLTLSVRPSSQPASQPARGAADSRPALQQ